MARIANVTGEDDKAIVIDASKVTHIVELGVYDATMGGKPDIHQRCQVFFVGGASVIVKSSVRDAAAALLEPFGQIAQSSTDAV